MGRVRRFALMVAALAATCAAAPAQEGARAPRPRAVDDMAAEKARREDALRAAERRIQEGAERDRRLAAEIGEGRADRARLSAELVAAAARMQGTEARMSDLEASLAMAAERDRAIRRSLDGRRTLVAEVLAALQRLGRSEAPPFLVRPDDVLAALRSSTLLTAAVSGLSDEARALAGDLAELARLRERQEGEREVLRGEARALADESARLGRLAEERARQIAADEADLAGTRVQAQTLGREARSLRELVDRLATEIDTARREADEARRVADARQRETRQRLAAAATRDPARLAPRIPFEKARGQLGRPVAGPIVRGFGAPDGQGGTARGIVIGARAGAVVTSPCEGSVAFAGPFRTFGLLLIIDAGEGYYLLLAGMEQITVEVGQFLLAGEPVGRMGQSRPTSAAFGSVEVTGPALYVELRKSGGSIDPGPWWSKSQGEKVRG